MVTADDMMDPRASRGAGGALRDMKHALNEEIGRDPTHAAAPRAAEIRHQANLQATFQDPAVDIRAGERDTRGRRAGAHAGAEDGDGDAAPGGVVQDRFAGPAGLEVAERAVGAGLHVCHFDFGREPVWRRELGLVPGLEMRDAPRGEVVDGFGVVELAVGEGDEELQGSDVAGAQVFVALQERDLRVELIDGVDFGVEFLDLCRCQAECWMG